MDTLSKRFKYLALLNFIISFSSLMIEQAAVLTLLTRWGAAYQGIVLVAASAPFIALAGIIGRLCDKYARSGIITCSRALELVAGGLLIFFSFDNLWVLIAVLAIKATANASFEVAKYGFIAETVPSEKLNKANGWIVPGMHVGAILGFICSSFLMAYDPYVVVTVYMVCISLSNILAALIDKTAPSRPKLSPWAWPIDRVGVRTMFENRSLWHAVLASVGFYFALNFWFPNGLNAICIQQYGTDEAYIATVGLSIAFALVLGSLAMLLPTDTVAYTTMRLGLMGAIFCLGTIVALPNETGVAAAGTAFFGLVAFFGTAFMVTNDAAIQYYLPFFFKGRVSGVITFSTHCLVLISGVTYSLTAMLLEHFQLRPSYCLLVPMAVMVLILPLLYKPNVSNAKSDR